MKKTLLLSLLAAILAGLLPLRAETVAPYSESFTGMVTSYEKFAPVGWVHYLGSSYYKTPYTAQAEGGHTTGFLQCGKLASASYFDAFITPAVTGNVSLWIKKMTADGKLDIYTSTDGKTLPYAYQASGQKYTGTVTGLDQINTEGWTQVTLPDVPAGTYLAFVPSNIGICDFTAASAEINKRTELKITLSKPNSQAVPETQDHKVTFQVKVVMQNLGDDTLTGPFDFSIVNNTNNDKPFGSFSIPGPLARYESVEVIKEITGDCDYAPETVNNKFVFTEASTGASDYLYYTYVPFAPVYSFVMAEEGKQEVTQAINFGICESGKELTYWVRNTGTDGLQVSSISLPEGFSLTSESSFAVAAGEAKAVTIKYNGTGYTRGTMTVATDKLGEKSYRIEGLTLPQGAWRESFEAETLPAGFLYTGTWNLKSDYAQMAQGENNKQWIDQTSTSYPSTLITPALQAAQGDCLYIQANKNDNISASMKVEFSSDRQNWSEPILIGASETTADAVDYFSNDPMAEDCSGYSRYAWRLFALPMPEGTVYARITGAGIRITDLAAPTLLPVEHDMVIDKHASPATAMVNNAYLPKLTLRNVHSAAETSHTVTLVIGTDRIPANEFEAHAPGTAAEYSFLWTPHAEGEVTAHYEVRSGDFSLDSEEFTVNVKAETASKQVQYGTYLISQDGPVKTSYKNSMSQIIYLKDKLAIDAGSRITGISYMGSSPAEISGHLTVWAQNTDQSIYEKDGTGWSAVAIATDTDDMTLVYEGDYTIPQVGSGSKEFVPILPIEFDTPFEYTGSNLRIHVLFESPTCPGGGYYAFDNTGTPDNAQFIKWQTDSDLDDLDLVYKWSINNYGTPVTYFNVEKDPASVKGTVTDAATQAPVADAQLTFTRDNLIYNATTDSEGKYSLNVYQPDQSFALTIDAGKYYKDYTHPEEITLTPGTEPNVFNFAVEGTSPFEAELTATPASGSTLAVLGSITLAGFPQGTTLTGMGDAALFNGSESIAVAKSSMYGEYLTLSFDELIKEAGTYELRVPQGYLEADQDGKTLPSPAFTLTYTVDPTLTVLPWTGVTFDPEEGSTIPSFTSVKITFPSTLAEDLEYDDEAELTALTSASESVTLTASMSDGILTLEAAQEITTDGTLTITLPKDLVMDFGTEFARFTPERTLTYTIDTPESVATLLSGQIWEVFTPDGRSVGNRLSTENVRLLPAGIYLLRSADGSTRKIVK